MESFEHQLCQYLHTDDLVRILLVNRAYKHAGYRVLYYKIVIDNVGGLWQTVRNDVLFPHTAIGTVISYSQMSWLMLTIRENRLLFLLIQRFSFLGEPKIGHVEKLLFRDFLGERLKIDTMMMPGIRATVLRGTRLNITQLLIGATHKLSQLALPELRQLTVGYGYRDHHTLDLFAQALVRGGSFAKLQQLEFVGHVIPDAWPARDGLEPLAFGEDVAPWLAFMERLHRENVQLKLKLLSVDGQLKRLGAGVASFLSKITDMNELLIVQTKVAELLSHEADGEHSDENMRRTFLECVIDRAPNVRALLVLSVSDCCVCSVRGIIRALEHANCKNKIRTLRVEASFPTTELMQELNDTVVRSQANVEAIELLNRDRIQVDIDLLWSFMERPSNGVEQGDAPKRDTPSATDFGKALRRCTQVGACILSDSCVRPLKSWYGGQYLGEFLDEWGYYGMADFLFYYLKYEEHDAVDGVFTVLHQLGQVKRYTVMQMTFKVRRDSQGRPILLHPYGEQYVPRVAVVVPTRRDTGTPGPTTNIRAVPKAKVDQFMERVRNRGKAHDGDSGSEKVTA